MYMYMYVCIYTYVHTYYVLLKPPVSYTASSSLTAVIASWFYVLKTCASHVRTNYILHPRRCVCFVFLRPVEILLHERGQIIYYILAVVFASRFCVLFNFASWERAHKGPPLYSYFHPSVCPDNEWASISIEPIPKKNPPSKPLRKSMVKSILKY